MKVMILALFFLLGFVFATVIPRQPPIYSHAPLTYRVNVDDHPMIRWAPIIKDFNKSIHIFVEQFLDKQPIPKGFYDGVQWFAKHEFHYQDFVRQVDAVANLTGIPFEKMMFLNLLYQFTTVKACTGIVLRNSEGKIIHGRNWDFGEYEYFGSMVSKVEYYRGGEKLFTEDTVAGSVFSITGIRHGAFAISLNARNPRGYSGTLLAVLMENNIPALWLVRKTFIEETNFADANKRLRETKISSPIYIIISGLKDNEGMVIERGTDHTHAYYELSDYMWFLVQTNYDRDQPDPEKDQRRIPIELKLAERGNEDFSEQVLMETMSAWPTFNIATIFTDILVPRTGYSNTTIWYGNNP